MIYNLSPYCLSTFCKVPSMFCCFGTVLIFKPVYIYIYIFTDNILLTTFNLVHYFDDGAIVVSYRSARLPSTYIRCNRFVASVSLNSYPKHPTLGI